MFRPICLYNTGENYGSARAEDVGVHSEKAGNAVETTDAKEAEEATEVVEGSKELATTGVEVRTSLESAKLQEEVRLSSSIDITTLEGPAGAMIDQIDAVSGEEGKGVEMMQQYGLFWEQYLNMFLPGLDGLQKQGMKTALATIMMQMAMDQEEVGDFLETLDWKGGGKALLLQAVGLGNNLGDYPDFVMRLGAMMRLISDMKQSHADKKYSSMLTNPIAMMSWYDMHIDGKKSKDLRALIKPTKDGKRQAGYTTIASALYQEDQALTLTNTDDITTQLEKVFTDLSGKYGAVQHSEFTAMLTAGPLGLEMIDTKRQTLLEKSGVVSRLCDLPWIGSQIQERLAPLFDLYGGYEGYQDLVASSFTELTRPQKEYYNIILKEYLGKDGNTAKDTQFVTDYLSKIGVTTSEKKYLEKFSRSKFDKSIRTIDKKSMDETTKYGSFVLPASTWKLLGPDYLVEGKTLTDSKGKVQSQHASLARQYALSKTISILLQNKPLLQKLQDPNQYDQSPDLISRMLHLYVISPQLQNYVLQHSDTAREIENNEDARGVIQEQIDKHQKENPDEEVSQEEVRRTHTEVEPGTMTGTLPAGFAGAAEGVNMCALNARKTLQTHTGCEFSGKRFLPNQIPQGHAIDLINAGKSQQMLVPLFEGVSDWNERIIEFQTKLNERVEDTKGGETLFDVYIESPRKSGVHQGHRIVVALTTAGRQVYDPSRDGSMSRGSVAHDLRRYFERNALHYPTGEGGKESKFFISKIGYATRSTLSKDIV